MKKFYTLLAALGVTASMAAQQLPNAGFEDAWTDCVPWTSKGNTKVQGTTPSPWIISNTVGTGSLGKTTVGDQVAGCNSSKAVKLYAKEVMRNNIPGYMSLGTAWSTSVMGKENDGGVFGGIEFTFRPDALSFDYKRTGGSENKSSVVAYSWKGTYTQIGVPGCIVISGTPQTATMTDRDRNILNMDTSKGGKVTPSPYAALISKIEYYIAADQEKWNNLVIPFEYASDAAPEKINVIFAASEYFNATPVLGPELTVDNVKLVYYSRLSGLKFKDADIADFDPDKFDYELDEVMPTDEADLEATTMGNSGVAKAAVELDQQNNVAKITVTNAHGNDADGQNSHVYTVQFLPAGSSINDVIDMTTADVRYVDLYGNAVAADALINGQTYIKLVNGKATKVIANN